MPIIRAKSICEKVDLFIKVAEEDGNGKLSWNEVIGLCNKSLEGNINIFILRYLPQKEKSDKF